MRISLTAGTAMGNDMRLFDEKVAGSRNFVNSSERGEVLPVQLEGFTPLEKVAPAARGPVDPVTLRSRTAWASRAPWSDSSQGGHWPITDFIWNEFYDWYIGDPRKIC